MADGGDRCDAGQVEALGRELVDGGELGQQHAGQPSRRLVRSPARAARRRGEPGLRLERAGEGGGELPRDGPEAAAGLLDERGDAGGVRVLPEQLAQGVEPVGALAAEGQGELLALVQAVGQGTASLGGGVVMGQQGGG